MTKQDYIVSKLLDRSIIANGNCKVHRAVYDRLTEVLGELQRIDGEAGVDSELAANITLITALIDQLYMKTSMQHFLQHELGEPMEHKEKCSISASFLCKLVHIEAFGESGKRMGIMNQTRKP